MSTCKNCKYWGEDGECSKILEERDSPGASDATIQVHVHDDSGLYVKLMTGPEFGCNKFKESPT